MEGWRNGETTIETPSEGTQQPIREGLGGETRGNETCTSECFRYADLVTLVKSVGAHGALGIGQRTVHVRLGAWQEVVKVELSRLDLKQQKKQK